MRLAGLIKGGYYPTPLRCVDLLSGMIRVNIAPHRMQRETLRVLDPCCGTGEASNRLAMNLSRKTGAEIETYGVELDANRAGEAALKMDFLLSSDIFQTMIANNLFHVLYLNPPYDWEEEHKRMEQAFLAHCTRYLAPGALLIFVVPKHRLAVSAHYLSAHYDRLKCWRFPDEEYEDFDQVVLMAARKVEPWENPHSESVINAWAACDPQEMDALLEEPGYSPHSVMTDEQANILFTVRRVEPQRAAREARKTGLWTNPALRDSLWPAGTPKTQPLMPLRHGHMAMLVAAGFLDNLCLEANGTQILVKGRTTKRMEQMPSEPGQEVWQDRMHTTIRTLNTDTGEIRDIKTVGRKTG